MNKLILGIAGLNGSGKSTVAQYLTEHEGFTYLSFRNYICKELDKRNLEHVRENMRRVANEIRAEYGSSYLLNLMKEDIQGIDGPVVIESFRTLNEVRHLKEIGGTLLAITAPSKIRYERIAKRKSSTDHITYEELLEQERKESISKDPDVQNLPMVIQEADTVIQNNDLDSFYIAIKKYIEEIG